MTVLRLSAFGPPIIRVDDREIQVPLRKAIALLVYLVVTGRTYSRDALATLLWPEFDQRRARAGLRRTLSALQKAVGPDWLEVNQETIGPNPEAHITSDVLLFHQALERVGSLSEKGRATTPMETESLSEAVELCQGNFLEGFSLPDAPEFDEWQFFTAEELRRQLAMALQCLSHHFADSSDLDKALDYARHWLRLDPAQEAAHRHLMKLYARSNQRSAACRQYQECVRILAEEFGAEPEAQTTLLYTQIRQKRTDQQPSSVANEAVVPPAILPAMVKEGSFLTHGQDGHLCVARETELDRLSALLQASLTGQGQVALVTGEAGSGKSTLLVEFAHRAQEIHPDLSVVTGHCSSFAGIGDPYLPFRQMMAQLVYDHPTTTGDEPSHKAGKDHLTDTRAEIWQALLQTWPDLADILLPSSTITAARYSTAPQPESNEAAPYKWPLLSQQGTPAQVALFERLSGFLNWVSSRHPLLMIIDDGQWIDEASVSILFHLSRSLTGHRVLLLLAYRPGDVSLGRDGKRHPVEPLANELRRLFGDIRIDLDQASGRSFVDALLDTQPNAFGREFRDSLSARTQGHPLFTVELLRDMRGRGDVVQDETGLWAEGATVNWKRLPSRVEAVIEERVQRLEPELRQALISASMQGETFLAEIVAQLMGIDPHRLFQQMTALDKIHSLVFELGQVDAGDRHLTRYRFTHTLIQQYLYNATSASERRLLHHDLATALEDIFHPNAQEMSYKLALHWLGAGETMRAADYFLVAGDRARNLYAQAEAVDLYLRALHLFTENGAVDQAARTWMKLGLTYHQGFDFERSRDAYEVGFRLWQPDHIRQPIDLPPAPHPLRLVSQEPPTLDPAMCHDDTSSAIIAQLFCGLATITPELDVMPELAQSWEVLEDGRQYVFHLRPGTRWSDGMPLTSDDFLFAWRRVLSPETGSPSVGLLFDIKGARGHHEGSLADGDRLGISAPDSQTLVVELESPASYFPHIVSREVTFPVPKHVVERFGEAWTSPATIVSSGPFRLISQSPNSSMRFARNPLFTGRMMGNVSEVHLLISPMDSADPIQLYEQDTIDMLDLGWQPRAMEMADKHAVEHSVSASLNVQYIGFDLHSPPFSDRRVRQAFAHAVDREHLANGILRGFEAPALGGLIPPAVPGHSPDIGLPFDAQRARDLLAEAGYPGGSGFPPVRALRSQGNDTITRHLSQQWHRILGIDIRWQAMEWGHLLSSLMSDPPNLIVLGWVADYPDPDNPLRFIVDTPWIKWNDPQYWQLIETARRMTDQSRRIRYYQLADSLLCREVPLFPILYGRRHHLHKPWLADSQKSLVQWSFWRDLVIQPHEE